MTGFFTSPRIAWGPGAIEQLSGLGARRALVLVDSAVEGHDGTRRVAEELAKADAAVELRTLPIAPDRVDRVVALVDKVRASGPDWLVVVGGGRAIDAAKAVRLLLVRPEVRLSAPAPLLDLPDPASVRIAAVPTTSGSGGDSSGLLDLFGEDGTPIELAHRGLTPDWALLDPAFSATLPAELVLEGAAEAASQALEAYLSAWANPFSDALATDALATVFERLPHALRWSDDPDARAALHYAASSAGLAVANAQRGVAHALARALMGPTGLSYARLLGIALPSVLEFDRSSARDRIEALTTAVLRGEDAARVPLAARFARLFDTFRVPTTLAAAGVDVGRVEAQRASIVDHALRSPAVLANPRVPSSSDVAQLLDRITSGARGAP
jgi:alcohol dehydrogenase class IV